ncbi:MAG: c-type cytochrome [Betaproteobacteria bacterium]
MRLSAFLLSLGIAACGSERPALSGEAERGRLLLRQFGCGSCHRISGVADAQGNVGPPLDGVARRVYLAGVVPNSPENMTRWIRTPKSFAPQTAMPDLGVGEEHARDMVAYLHSLR